MVLENIIPGWTAEKKPWEMLPVAFLYATAAIFLSQWIFPAYAAIVAVFLTTIASLPLMISVLNIEKDKEASIHAYLRDMLSAVINHKESRGKLLEFFAFLFLGLTLATTFWFVVLPTDLAQNLFYVQINTIRDINVDLSGGTFFQSYFSKILLNNLKVLAFTILFSLIYGAGAIFILTWNASVIGVAIGSAIKNASVHFTETVGLPGIAGYTTAVTVGLSRYLIHGIPEIMAYFIGALAGGIISLVIIKQEYETPKFKESLKHISGLLIFSIALLLIGALIEVNIAPLIPLYK
ncbi:MAG: stage II sporulation protein M [DPANN group archaeon]|nr:stage II sporulation protein M [DPANN group archaeon]